MKTLFSILLLIGVGITSNGKAQSLDGKWQGNMTMPNGNVELIYNFKVKADSLIGDITSSMGTLPIENGKVDGKKFSFDVNVNGQVFNNTGVLKGDTVKLALPQSNQQMILSRIKEESKIDGKWVGKVSGPQGDFDLTFTFNVKGNKLTGTSSSSMGEMDLTNGVVNGNKFSFDVDAGGMTISHKCTYLPDDSIKVKADVNGQEIDMKLARVDQ